MPLVLWMVVTSAVSAQTRVLPALRFDSFYFKAPIKFRGPSGDIIAAKHADSYTKAYKKTRNFWQEWGDDLTFKNYANNSMGIDILIYRPLSIFDYNVGLLYRNSSFKIGDTYNTINTFAPNINITIKTSTNPERASRLAFVAGGEYHYNFRFRQRDDLRNVLSDDISYITPSGFAASLGIFWNFTPGAGDLYTDNTTRSASADAYFNFGVTYGRYFYNPFSSDFTIDGPNGASGFDMDYSVIRFFFTGRGQFEGTRSY